MRRRTLLPALLAPALLPWASAVHAAPAERGELVNWPSISLLDGAPWSAERVRGQAVVVVFWTLTCPFCTRHNAHIEKLHRAAIGKPLTVLGVVLRERDPQAVRAHMLKHDWRFPVTLDGAAMVAALSSRRGVPITVTVDRQGRLREVIPGEMFEEDVLDFLKLTA